MLVGGPWRDRAWQEISECTAGAAPVHTEEPGFALWEQGNTMGDGDYSEIRWLQTPDEGLCNP